MTSFLTPMLEFLPEKRATARDVLSHPWLDGILPAPLPLPSAPPLDGQPEPEAAALEARDRNDEGGMVIEDREEEDEAVTHRPRGVGEEPAEKEVIEESIPAADFSEVRRGQSSEANILPEDSGLIAAEASAAVVTMMEV